MSDERKRPASEVSWFLQLLDEAYNRKSWHGTNLRGSIRGLSAEQADWRPAHRRHSIAEIVAHAAYWKYTVRRRLRGDARGSFGLKGSDWFALARPLSESAWREIVGLLEAEHGLLRDAVARITPAALHRTAVGSKTTNVALIRGVALHDIYHAGQIQAIKGWQKQARTASPR